MAIPWGAMLAAQGISMIPAGLSALFGGNDMNRRLRNRALQEFDPFNLSRNREQLFQQTLGGAGFNQARSEVLGAGQAAQGALNRHLGQTGLGRSGVGTGMRAAAAAAPGVQLGKMTADAWSQAMQQAMQLAQSRAGTIMGMPQQNMTLPMMGAGFGAVAPFLFRMLQARQMGTPDENNYSDLDQMMQTGMGQQGVAGGQRFYNDPYHNRPMWSGY